MHYKSVLSLSLSLSLSDFLKVKFLIAQSGYARFFCDFLRQFYLKIAKNVKNIHFSNLQAKKVTLPLFSTIALTFLLANIFFTSKLQAATFSPNSPVGTVILLGGRKFVKFNSAGLFVGLDYFQPLGSPGSATSMPMQNFTTANCNSFQTPTGSNYTLVGNLVDSRDNKSYEVRKFSDGKCWMVDNLRYGGGTNGSGDYCKGKTTARTANSQINSTAIATNGLNGAATGLVGDCRDAAVGITAAPCQGTTNCGYYYNWPAAIQDVRGWQGNSFQPTQPTTGICPQGWHLPTGGTTAQTSEFVALDIAIGGTGANQSSGLVYNFWHPGGNFKSVYSGEGGLGGQGDWGVYWSSAQYVPASAYHLTFAVTQLHPQRYSNKNFEYSVRCVKN